MPKHKNSLKRQKKRFDLTLHNLNCTLHSARWQDRQDALKKVSQNEYISLSYNLFTLVWPQNFAGGTLEKSKVPPALRLSKYQPCTRIIRFLRCAKFHDHYISRFFWIDFLEQKCNTINIFFIDWRQSNLQFWLSWNQRRWRSNITIVGRKTL